MKRILTTLSEKWAEYILEILVITIGILGAFLLNGWKERSDEKADLMKALSTMNEYLEGDLVSLKNAIDEHQVYQDFMITSMSLIEETRLPLDSTERQTITSALWVYNWIDPVPSDLNVFDELISSGTLREDDEKIFKALVEYNKSFEFASSVAAKVASSLTEYDLIMANARYRAINGNELHENGFYEDRVMGNKEIVNILELSRNSMLAVYSMYYQAAYENGIVLKELLDLKLKAE